MVPQKNWAQGPDKYLLKDWAHDIQSIATLKHEMNYGSPKNWAQGTHKYLLKDWAQDILSISTRKHELNYGSPKNWFQWPFQQNALFY